MSIIIKRGDAVILPVTTKPTKHHEPDFDIEMTADGRLIVRASGGAPFLTVEAGGKNNYVIDVLNFPYVDVAKRKAEMEKKAAAAVKK